MQTGSTCLCYFTVTARATLQTYLCVPFFNHPSRSQVNLLVSPQLGPALPSMPSVPAMLSPSPESSLPSAGLRWLSTPEVHADSIRLPSATSTILNEMWAPAHSGVI